LLVAAAASTFIATIRAADTPAAPDSPLKDLARQLARKRSAPVPGRPAPTLPPKEQLLRPEFRFKPAKSWLLLPDLARTLGSSPAEHDAVLQLLDAGVRELRKLLAAEGADNDVAAATGLFMSQLWQAARGIELPEVCVDALHAQIVGVFQGSEIAKMRDADKQRYWEFCIGYPIFIAGMAEVIESDEQRADLRKAAALAFESLIGVSPELVDIGPDGLTIHAGLEEAAAELAKEGAAPAAAPTPPPPAQPAAPGLASRDKLAATGPAIPGITYTAPAGWSRETKNGNLIFRATLRDVNDHGQPVENNDATHQAVANRAFLGKRVGGFSG
jgi:hypothetical protein